MLVHLKSLVLSVRQTIYNIILLCQEEKKTLLLLSGVLIAPGEPC